MEWTKERLIDLIGFAMTEAAPIDLTDEDCESVLKDYFQSNNIANQYEMDAKLLRELTDPLNKNK